MIANLHIRTSWRDGKTCLDKTYFTPPLKIADITEGRQAELLQLMLVSSSPGILDEDAWHIKIELEENCSMQLHTQSYQRLFNMKKGATQLTEVFFADNCTFIYLPHPAVPHERSVFTATNNIYLGDNCRLIWGEILTCGRKLNGEIFLCTKYHNKTSVFINNKLVVKENLLIQPSSVNPLSIGQLEGFTHQASLIVLDENADCTKLKDLAFDYLSQKDAISFGVSEAPANGIIIRIHGNKAEQLFNIVKSLSQILPRHKLTKIQFP